MPHQKTQAMKLISCQLIGLLRTLIRITRDIWNIGQLNVNSTYGKTDEVIHVLSNTCRFDVFSVAEYKFDGSVNSSLFAYSEYRVIRRDRKKGLLQPFAEQYSNQMVLNRYV